MVEIDLTGACDKLDPGLLRKAGRKHRDGRGVLLYGERWVQAPTLTEAGEGRGRQRGTPQGEVLGPRLLTLFLPSALDRWRRREGPTCPFAR